MTRTRLRVNIFLVLLASFCCKVTLTARTSTISAKYLEEQAADTVILDLKENLSPEVRDDVNFKLVNQYMTSDSDVIDDFTKWVRLDEQSGIVRVQRPVDRESDCGGDEAFQDCVVHVKITRWPQSEFQIIDLNLLVTDINDHAPVFPVSSLIVNVSEAASVSTRVNLDQYLAKDKDTGNNAEIRYALSRNKFFGLHQRKDETGAPHLELVVADDLDHETSRFEDLRLTARDLGTPIKSSHVDMRIQIIDANDNSPVFEKPVYTVNVRESLAVDSVITTVMAHDADSERYGNVRYYVPTFGNSKMGRNLVRVEPRSGRVFLNEPLNHAKHNNIRIAIGARDSSRGETKVGKTILELLVADVNDNTPTIRIDVITTTKNKIAYLSESAKVGSYVAQVSASDADTGLNGRVVIEISTRVINLQQFDSEDANDFVDNYFVLAEGGLIATAKSLDREVHPGFVIDVIACDSAVPKRCARKNLTVMMLDENDNRPVFANLQRQKLREGSEIGTVVTTVTAMDRDNLHKPSYRLAQNGEIVESRSGVIRYSLRGGRGSFVMDKISGKIKLTTRLDYESKSSWQLTVIATDEGNPPMSTSTNLTVDVVNINDNAPFFVKPAVSNSSATATIAAEDIIMTMKAEDYDFDKIIYSISLENDKKPVNGGNFTLDENSGVLRLNLSNPKLEDLLGEHQLKIQAKDSGSPALSVFTTLRVMVTDLPLDQIQSLRLKEIEVAAAKGDYTVIMIASLASATVLLIVVLTGVVVKCRKENKEIRTYNCRTAESRKGWQVALNQGDLARDAIVTSSNQIASSHDSNLNNIDWSRTERRPSFDNKHQLIKCQTRNSSSSIAQRSLDRKISSFGSPMRPKQRTATHADGDSGRGDSDHDTGSYEGKECLPAASVPVVHYHNDPDEVAIVDMSHYNDMGPMCTNSCREYGHSDSCWMHVYDSSDSYQDLNPSVGLVQSLYPYPVPSAIVAPSSRGLETICETQPLHSVLRTTDDEQVTDMSNCEGEGQTRSNLLPQTMYYDPSSTYVDSYTLPHHHSVQYIPPHSPTVSNYEFISSYHSALPAPPRAARSPSDLFHDGANVPAVTSQPHYYHDSPTPRYEPINFHSSARCLSPSVRSECTSSGQRRSTASLHGELLHQRFLAVAQGTSTADAELPECGNVSMQETERIINDIDQLIDH